MNHFSNNFLDFLNNSHCSYQVVENIKNKLTSQGFICLNEKDKWQLSQGGKYFVERNGSGIIAFKINEGAYFNIIASHTDSPCFKLSENTAEPFEGGVTVGTEVYGGAIYNTWLDRPLGISGRVILKDGKIMLLDTKKPIFTIPNLSIHLNREINNGYKYTVSKDMRAVAFTQHNERDIMEHIISLYLNKDKKDIFTWDIELYDTEKACFIGEDDQCISSSKLDDLSLVYSSLTAFCESSPNGIQVLACLDNEEIGSRTQRGADGSFIERTLERIVNDKETFYRYLAASTAISADVAQGFNPNHPQKFDRHCKAIVNGGIVLKTAASQSYATSCEASAIFKKICESEKINYSIFKNHPDIRGGSTIGNMLSSRLGIIVIDMGIPVIAMHSAKEIAGVKDCYDSYRFFKTFYNSNFSLK